MSIEQQATIERLAAENAALQLQIERIRRDTIEECANEICEEAHYRRSKVGMDEQYLAKVLYELSESIRALPQGAGQPTGAAHVPDDADWGAIQAACDEDCPVSMIAAMSHRDCSWGDMADRIVKYAEAAFAQGKSIAASAAPSSSADQTEHLLAVNKAASMERMFMAACEALGLINEALGLDPDDGGAEPILEAIAELKAAALSRESSAAIGELPPLPERDGDWAGDDWYTAHSMREYARQAIRQHCAPAVPTDAPQQEPVAWYEQAASGEWFLAYSFNPNAVTKPLYFAAGVQP